MCLTAIDACTSTTFCDTIGVCLDTAQSDFSYSTNGTVINFSEQAQNADSYLWDFGDGNFSTNANPSHIYQNYGTYTVCLTVDNECYTDSICKSLTLCPNQGQAAFTYQNSFTPLAVQFTSQATNATSHYWTFGDGSFSTNKNPLKVFSDPLVFDVCLTITDSCGLQDSTCSQVDLTMFDTKELAWLNSIEVYPNPTEDKLFIKSGEYLAEEVQIELLNVNGQRVLSRSESATEQIIELNLESYSKGLYLLRIKVGESLKAVKINRN